MRVALTHVIQACRKTFIMAILCIAIFLVYTLLLAIFNHTFIAPYLMLNPLISGFLHNGLEHYLINLGLFFAAILCTINRDFTMRYLYWLTVLISSLYLPITLLGYSLPAIGISGLCYYLIVRALLTWKVKYKIGILLFWILTISEVYGLMVLKDDIAHGVHLIGIGLGLYSIKTAFFKSQNEIYD